MADLKISGVERTGEVRRFRDHGKMVLGTAGAMTLGKGMFEPGWRWSEDVKPLAGTDSCQVHHLGYVQAGAMGIRLDDGREFEIHADDLVDIPPGHDAWVIGDETCVMLDASPEATGYATGPAQRVAPYADDNVAAVRAGYAAFNSGDIDTLMAILAKDCVQHVPGKGQLAGEYKGVEAVLGYYGKLGELTDGTFRVDLSEVHSDGKSHVCAIHQVSATRNGVTRVSRGSLLFTFYGGHATDLLELHLDQAGDDAFFA
ncbi:nuclear transport factor 2 family protein [Actinokineospora xionganensis]|uniref:Nuclear transport factor 2 family protein n=1 Tax=Actinokineospora xionganensis TaxID=2684470 RepID=A0ABR7LBG7_9PSEU|nr:nuclear transport factor 2 family protein [Actinokineospora xionganensis]MBC6449907.1 nuclear transport factor 2 family protein [Actinokineospora xionganensis]